MKNESFRKLHNEIQDELKPTPALEVKLKRTVDKLLARVTTAIEKLNLNYTLEPILVGSVAKDTYLSNPDIDIFIMFPVSVPIVELRELGLLVGKNVLPTGEERYAEHPYISGKFDGFDTDIVPCYKLAKIEDRMTAVDRTPFHTRFIMEHLKPGQRDEVRLFKQFIKGIGAYGAEIEVLGFSGYLCELLILKYGTFLNLLKGTNTWIPGLVFKLDLDQEKKANSKVAFESKTELSKELAIKFKNELMVFIDPVDSSRNVASALGLENLNLFIKAAQTYLKHPRREFFFPKPIKPLSLSKLKSQVEDNPNTLIGISFATPAVVPDILHGQLRKCQKTIQKLLDTAGFGVEQTKYYANEQTLILLELKTGVLPEVETHMGPPEGHKNSNDFLSKWRVEPTAVGKPYLKDHRWYVDIKRQFVTPKELLNAKLFHLNVGKHVNKSMKEHVEIHQDLAIVQPGLEKPITQFFCRKNSWEY